jgi:hypothetical protein
MSYTQRKSHVKLWMVGTHTLKIRCVCTDENATCAARNLLKIQHTRGFTYDCVISTTTLISVSSRTHPHTEGMALEKVPGRFAVARRSRFIYTNGIIFDFCSLIAGKALIPSQLSHP